MARFIVAHDVGTSGNKATLFTIEGKMLRSILVEYPTRYFNAGWAEQDPRDWWRAVCAGTRELAAGINAKDIMAVSFSGQMMGCLCVDKSGTPLRDSIIWADMRATEEARRLEDKIAAERFYRIVGHRLSCSYSLEKLMWVKKNQPDVYRNTHKMLNAKDYLVFRLTGQFLTDYSDASGTNAFDLNRFQWSEEICSAAGIEMDKLPQAVESTRVAGEVPRGVAEECGLAPGTKVVIGGGDGMCASVGAGSISVGKTYNCLGSSAWICSASKTPIYDQQMRTVNWAHIVPGLVAPSGTMQTAGAAFTWLKNELGVHEMEQARRAGKSAYDFINEEINSSTPGSKGLLFLPYLMGERSPRWNTNARGAFIGLSMEHKKGDIFRSVIEGIAMNLNVILGILQKDIAIEKMVVIGGLAKGEVQRQILADVYGMDIQRLNFLEEATSIGAAITAGVGVGALKGFDDVDNFIAVDACTSPRPAHVETYRRLQPVFNKAYFDLVEVYDQLSECR
jgi:xylulokinase